MSKEIWPGIGLSSAPVDWAKYTAAAAQGQKSAEAVEKRRASGTDFSTFIGISRKADITSRRGAPSMMRKGGKRGPAVGTGLLEDSKPGRIRAFLATGPQSSAAVAQELGVDVQRAISLMRNDVRRGRIVKIGAVRPLLYALPGAA